MISEHIKRNTYYTFAFNLSEAESVFAALKHLQIDTRCARMLSALLPGQCIARQTQASWSSAFLVQIDFVEPARDIGVIEYDQHGFVPAISAEQTEKIIDELYKLASQHKADVKPEAKSKNSDLDKIAMQLLKLRVQNPYVPVARLFEKLGKIRFQAQITIREKLEEKGLAKFEETRIGRSNMLLMDMTDEGFKALGLPIPDENKGRGSITHRHFAHWVKQFYENKGCKTHLEFVLPNTNHPVDVAVESENHWHCFEICVTAFDNVVSHIKACFEESNLVECLTFIAGTQKELKELKKLVQQNMIFASYADRIKFEVIEHYMVKELKK